MGSAQSCLTLCDPVDCKLPGFSVHGIVQARILEWVAISSSRGSSHARDQTLIFLTQGLNPFHLPMPVLYYLATWEAQQTSYILATGGEVAQWWINSNKAESKTLGLNTVWEKLGQRETERLKERERVRRKTKIERVVEIREKSWLWTCRFSEEIY